MKHTLDDLSNNEWQLYKTTISLKGTIESVTQQLSENGTYDKYRIIHQQYLELFNTTADDKIKSEKPALLKMQRLIIYVSPRLQ